MSLDTPLNRVDYIGNGNTRSYSYNFKIFNNAHLKVIQRDTSGVETSLALNADYTVEGAGSGVGGTIQLINGNLPAGATLTIRRVVDIIQETDIRNQSEFYPEVVEDSLDYQTMIAQAQQDEIDRSIKLPETLGSGFDTSLPSNIKLQPGKTLVINSSGSGFEFGPSSLDIEGFVQAANSAMAEAQSSAGHALNYKNLAESFKDQAKAAATASDDARDEAQLAEANAYEYRNQAQTAEASAINNAAQALQSKNQAVQANTEAQAARDLAKDWATKIGDTVDGVEFSAKHYADNAQAYRVKFYNDGVLVGFATEVNFSPELKATVTPSGRINLDVESITYQPTPYSYVLLAEHIIAGEIVLSQIPPYPEWVRLIPEGGIEQLNGSDYRVEVSGYVAKLIWKNMGLDGVLETNERILLVY